MVDVITFVWLLDDEVDDVDDDTRNDLCSSTV
jgi:hypothetical protein